MSPSFEDFTDLAPVPRLAPVQCLWSWPAWPERMRWKHARFMQCHCFLDTKKCQSTKHIAHSRPYQKVHLALAAFLHWAPLQVHQKVLKQPNLIRIRNHTDQNEVCFCWESIWPKACPKTSPPKESPMVYRRSWWESCMLDVTRRKPKLYLSLLQPPRLLFWRYRRFLQTSMSWLSCFSSKKT